MRCKRAHSPNSPDCLPEDFHLEHIGNDLLGLPVQVRMHNGDVVCAGAEVREGESAQSISIHPGPRPAKFVLHPPLHAMTFPSALNRSSTR